MAFCDYLSFDLAGVFEWLPIYSTLVSILGSGYAFIESYCFMA